MGPVGLFGGIAVYNLTKKSPTYGLWGALALIAGGHLANYLTDYPDPIFGQFHNPGSNEKRKLPEEEKEIDDNGAFTIE